MSFNPQPENINSKARAGYFYARPSGTMSVTVARIAQVAAKNTTGITTANMVKAIANSAWNKANFTYSMTGVQNYTNYGFPGPQYAKTGDLFPLLWIPTADGKEPEAVFGGLPGITRDPGAPASDFRLKQPDSSRTAIGTMLPGARDTGTSDGRTTGSTAAGGTGGYTGPLSLFGKQISWGWIIAGAAAVAAAGVYVWKRSKKRKR